MEENFQEYLFTPKCFKKDLKKIFKYIKNDKQEKQKTLIKGSGNNRIFEINNKNSFAYLTSVYSDISPGLILEKLREIYHLKLWFPYIKEMNSVMKISQYCDILELDVALPILKYLNTLNKLKIIRYWSYDLEEHSYFLVFKPFNNTNYFDNIKSGGFIINVNPDRKKSETGFKKSQYSSYIDTIYKNVGLNFCSSLENFIGSVKMHKYNLIMNEHANNTVSDDSESVDAYKYLIHYFYNVKLEDDAEIKSLQIQNLIRKITELDHSDLNQMKTYFEVKNEVAIKYGDNYFSENEIIRYVVCLGSDTENILLSLEELVNFRKSYKPNEIKFEVQASLNFDFLNFISLLCQDKHMRPVILIRLKYISAICNNDNSSENLIYKIIRYIIYIISKSIEVMPSNIDKYVIIIDAKNAPPLTNDFMTENIKKLFLFFIKFFPERLADIWIINKGINFSSIWKNILNIIELLGASNVLNKIKISNNYKEDFSQFMNSEKIEII